ncbi:MAG: NAD-binding protein [Methanocellales archaeon]
MVDISKFYENKLYVLLAFFLLIVISFSIIFMIIEEKSFVDSIYWAVVTLATVGYGDITPKTEIGKIFTMILIIMGITLYGLIIQSIGSTMVERVFKEVMGMKECNFNGHVIIAGWESLGEELLIELKANNVNTAVITKNPDAVQSIKNLGAYVICGDYTKDQTLLSAGIKNARAVAIIAESDLDVLVTALRCKALNKNIEIIAKVENTDIIEVVKEAGVRIVINPDLINSRLLASAAFEPHIVELLEEITSARFGNDLREFKVQPRSALAEKTVEEVQTKFKKETGLLLIAVIKAGKTIPNPSSDMVINAGDGVILMGKSEQFENARHLI